MSEQDSNRLLMPWGSYKVDGHGHYIYVPGDDQMPTFSTADMLALLQDYQGAYSDQAKALESSQQELADTREALNTAHTAVQDALSEWPKSVEYQDWPEAIRWCKRAERLLEGTKR